MPRTPVAAFFDLDRTVLARSSASLWARFEHRKGRLSGAQMLRLAWWTLLYRPHNAGKVSWAGMLSRPPYRSNWAGGWS